MDFVKINVDENGELAQKYNVFSIPTLAIFKNGEVVSQKWELLQRILQNHDRRCAELVMVFLFLFNEIKIHSSLNNWF